MNQRKIGAITALTRELKKYLSWINPQFKLLEDMLMKKDYMSTNEMLDNVKVLLARSTKKPSINEVVHAICSNKPRKDESIDYSKDPEVIEYKQKITAFSHSNKDKISQILFKKDYQELGFIDRMTVVKMCELNFRQESTGEVAELMKEYNSAFISLGIFCNRKGITI